MTAPRVQPQNAAGSGWARKAAALLEVLGIFIGGSFAAGWLGPRLGMPFPNLGAPNSDFVAISGAWLKFFLLQYACLLAPAFAIGWWRRRMKPRDYGLTRSGKQMSALMMQGLTAFALVGMVIKLLWLARRFIPLGPEPFMWTFIGHADWIPAFWLFLAVASFAITPSLEELFFRGYCQTRLEEDFGGIGAIVIVAVFTALGHNQYHHLNILSIGGIVSAILCFLGIGWVYWRSRSLLPGVIIHGAMNLPTKGRYDFVPPAVMILVLIFFWKDWLGMIREFGKEAAARSWKFAAFWGAIVAVAMVIGFETRPGVFIPVAFLGLAAALLIEFRGRPRMIAPNEKPV